MKNHASRVRRVGKLWEKRACPVSDVFANPSARFEMDCVRVRERRIRGVSRPPGAGRNASRQRGAEA